MTAQVITSIRSELKRSADPLVGKSFERFFKERARFYGVKSATVGKIARDTFKKIKDYEKKAKFSLIEELLKAKYVEEAMIGYEWAEKISKSFDEQDFSILESWLTRYVSNWAECDTLCNHAMGSFVDRFPAYVEKLKIWARSTNRWMRRGAAVTLILPARRGKFLKDVFDIADILLGDEDDLVQKGYGWLLKEASKLHRKEVFDYIMENKKAMPRTALRYAVEKMPEGLRKKAMDK
ncbi:MAG TPA: DNA alkylation repair protein [Chitinivibrionales bacterium]|nr:DNA alkylation repair protein [Chitinivibrionales bacterium]